MELTPDNYYSAEADDQFWSFSLFKQFQQCEAGGLYKLQDHRKPDHPPMALVVGNYVHSYFESKTAHQKFLHDERWNIFKSKKATKRDETSDTEIVEGKVLLDDTYADFSVADNAIKTLEADPFFLNAYQGEKESIVTGELYGLPWRGKIDCLNLEDGYFIDLKTSADLYRTFWHPEERRRLAWFEEYGYIMQLAIYQQLLYQQYGKMLQPLMFAVTKETVPDHIALSFRQEILDEHMDTVRLLLPEFDAVKHGERKAERCEHCDYCKRTKKATRFIDAGDFADGLRG